MRSNAATSASTTRLLLAISSAFKRSASSFLRCKACISSCVLRTDASRIALLASVEERSSCALISSTALCCSGASNPRLRRARSIDRVTEGSNSPLAAWRENARKPLALFSSRCALTRARKRCNAKSSSVLTLKTALLSCLFRSFNSIVKARRRSYPVTFSISVFISLTRRRIAASVLGSSRLAARPSAY